MRERNDTQKFTSQVFYDAIPRYMFGIFLGKEFKKNYMNKLMTKKFSSTCSPKLK